MSDAAIANIVTGVVTVVISVVGFLTLWIKLRYGVEEKTKTIDEKIDNNTTITMQASSTAILNSKTAVAAAVDTTAAVDRIDRKLNGGIDAAIMQAIDPIHKALEQYKTKVEKLDAYVHQRNHDLLTALQIQNNKLESILMKLDQQQKK